MVPKGLSQPWRLTPTASPRPPLPRDHLAGILRTEGTHLYGIPSSSSAQESLGSASPKGVITFLSFRRAAEKLLSQDSFFLRMIPLDGAVLLVSAHRPCLLPKSPSDSSMSIVGQSQQEHNKIQAVSLELWVT